jgi:hypothetical protein
MCAGHVRSHQGGQSKRGHREDDPPGCLQGDGQGGYSNPEITGSHEKIPRKNWFTLKIYKPQCFSTQI